MSTAVVEALETAASDAFNAFISVDDPAAGAEPPPGPLHGTPIAVKDLIDHAGRTTTAGSAFYRHRASRTAPCLTRLEQAGAVVIGRTNLHEFAFGFSSENPWFGPVLNPLDPRLSPGGSSGGSAAAVAAGIVPLAVGTDTGGSVRVPAALCGVIGLKVTYGLIPLQGVFPLVASLDTVGTIASHLDLVEKATRSMAGGAWRPTSPPTERLVVPTEWVATAPLDQRVASAFADFLDRARDAGFRVEHRALDILQPSPHQDVLIGREVARVHRRWREAGRSYGDDVRERIDGALEAADDPEAVTEADAWRERITTAMATATAEGTVLVTPSVAAMDKLIGVDRIGEHHHRTVLSWFTAPVNPTGHPALSVPLAGPGRRPSIQLIGAKYHETALLEMAGRLAAADLVSGARLPSE